MSIMKKETVRIKIYLTTHTSTSCVNDEDLIKYEVESQYYPNNKMLDDLTKFYYKQSEGHSPKWYKNYLQQNDTMLKSMYSGGFFVRTIVFNQEEYKFVICFGGIDNILNLEHIEGRFGLKIALNLADKLFTVKKNRISDTQANVKEDAVRGQEIKDFNFGLNTDLLHSVVVKPVKNDFATGNIIGSNSVSFTTLYTYEELNILLEKCLLIYQEDNYKEKYEFIDMISEIEKHDPLIKKIHSSIIDIYNSNDIGNVWFAPSDTDRMDSITDYKLYSSLISKKKKSGLYSTEIDLESVKALMEEHKIEVNEIDVFKKVKVDANYDDGSFEKTWNLLECLYANVSYEGNQYVMNSGKIYKINNDYYTSFEEKFNALDIFESLPMCSSATEKDYNLKVFDGNKDKYIHLDAKLTRDRNKIEICDIYDLTKNAFIHIKNYGVASKLSHVFAQAKISAESISNSEIKHKMLERIREERPEFELPKIEDIKVVVAIITSKELMESGHANLPFFSKVNAVSTLEYIKNSLRFQNASMTYIGKAIKK